jgi:hypothetical protein
MAEPGSLSKQEVAKSAVSATANILIFLNIVITLF